MRFNDNSLIVGYIKELLHSFNLPMIPVYTDDTVLYNDRVYIKDNYVCKYVDGDFKRIMSFAYDVPVLNLTKNMIINSSIYDKYTHTYLGEYLRFLRDYRKLDLMGMYNCFTDEQLSRVEYKLDIVKNSKDMFSEEGDVIKTKNTFSINTYKNDFLYYSIPIKFNQIYTIGLNCDSGFEVACILYNDVFISSTPDELVSQSYMKINGCTMNDPFIFDTHFSCAEDLWRKEKDLRMVIKLPRNFRSTITVLEGNFMPCANVVDGNFTVDIRDGIDHSSEVYWSKNSLLEVGHDDVVPFADRLIEYLLWNVITNIDFIDANIEKVQERIYKGMSLHGVYGIWDEELKKEIYERFLEEDITKGSIRYSNIREELTLVNKNLSGADEIRYILYAPNNCVMDDSGNVIEYLPIKSGESYELKGDDILFVFFTIKGKDTLVEKTYRYEVDPDTGEVTVIWEEHSEKEKDHEDVIEYKSNLEKEGVKVNDTISITNDTQNTYLKDSSGNYILDSEGNKIIESSGELINMGELPSGGYDESHKRLLNSFSIKVVDYNPKTKAKRFIDLYDDLYGYVDKDVESLLRLQ